MSERQAFTERDLKRVNNCRALRQRLAGTIRNELAILETHGHVVASVKPLVRFEVQQLNQALRALLEAPPQVFDKEERKREQAIQKLLEDPELEPELAGFEAALSAHQ